MTPAQLLRTVKPPEEPPSPLAALPPNTYYQDVTLPRYTSDEVEDDFDTAVSLLLSSNRFLLFLQDADQHYDILSQKARDDLDKHIELLQDFTGEWNDEEVY